jgi:hypothetical protein
MDLNHSIDVSAQMPGLYTTLQQKPYNTSDQQHLRIYGGRAIISWSMVYPLDPVIYNDWDFIVYSNGLRTVNMSL